MPRWDLLAQLECTSEALNPRKMLDRTDGLTNAHDRKHACYLLSTLKTLQDISLHEQKKTKELREDPSEPPFLK